MDSDSSDDYYALKKRVKTEKKPCPYMKTVNRYLLDFDFEKVCSVTLSNTNIYACLVCGLYFQGRGKGSPCYTHSVDKQHHVFLNVLDEKAYCLPDDYEIEDDSLDDIRFNLNPKFTDLDNIPTSALSLTGVEYIPGIVGLNPVRSNSYMSASIHALSILVPFRDKLLASGGPGLSHLMKKIWNYQNFKGIVSPLEFVHLVSKESGKVFYTESNDPMKFLKWIISRAGDGLFAFFELNLPETPVFKSDNKDLFIPTVELRDLLHVGDTKANGYLVMHINRFIQNDFFLEKNSSIVRFPLRGLNVEGTSYRLVAVICHEGEKIESGTRPSCISGKFVAYVMHPKTQQWYKCDGLRITKVLPQSVAIVESYVLVWERE